MKQTGKAIVINHKQVQKLDSSSCGEFCIYVAKQILNGRSPASIMNDFSDDLNENERILQNLAFIICIYKYRIVIYIMSHIQNFYKTLPKEYKTEIQTYSNYNKVHIQLPFRMIILGCSGSGKTNTCLNVIQAMNCFTKYYLFAKNTEEPLYKFLIDLLQKAGSKLKINLITYSNDLDELPGVDEFDKNENNLLIIDDMITEKESKLKNISDIFIRGRKASISTIFLSQSYYKIPKLIRQILIILF